MYIRHNCRDVKTPSSISQQIFSRNKFSEKINIGIVIGYCHGKLSKHQYYKKRVCSVAKLVFTFIDGNGHFVRGIGFKGLSTFFLHLFLLNKSHRAMCARLAIVFSLETSRLCVFGLPSY